MKGFWTDDITVRLKDLWAKSWSASQIAAELQTTRNAVLGKIHRLGLSGRVLNISPEELERRERKRRERRNAKEARRRIRLAPAMVASSIETPPPAYLGYSLEIPFSDLRSLSASEPNQCRFIAAEPPGPLYLACGNETAAGEPYCAHCQKVVLRLTDLAPAKRGLPRARAA